MVHLKNWRTAVATAKEIIDSLRKLGDPVRAEHSQRFFKTGPGEYGEGDLFLGIRVPLLRKEVRSYKGIDLNTLEKLLQSKWHEIRLFALLALVDTFRKSDPPLQEKVFNIYLNNTCRINNWDLVDLSAPHIAGAWLVNRDRSLLRRFAVSELLWERRISIIATQHFIRLNDFKDTLAVSDILLNDKEDLIQKAVGWMLREVGKRNREIEENFLHPRYRKMPRTMLRYAIEKFENEQRMKYLRSEI